MDYTHNPRRNDLIGQMLDTVRKPSVDGRLYGLYLGHVTSLEDPLKLNRIKVRLQCFEDIGIEWESDWVKQGTLFAGPTDPQRGIEAWGLDYPMPEVHSDVFVFFNGGDITDPYWFGVPRYRAGDRSVPRIEKDPQNEFSLRVKLPNGFEFAIETGGSVVMQVFGHFTSWVKGNWDAGARGTFNVLATRLVQGALSMIKKVSPQMAEIHYIRQDEDPELRDKFVDLMSGTPGKKDPGIRKPEDLT
jgi:hypothetical protein